MSNILLPEDIINLILSYAPDFRDNLKKCQKELLYYHRPCYYKRVHAGFKPGISDSPTWHNFSSKNNRIPIHYRTTESSHETIYLDLHAIEITPEREPNSRYWHSRDMNLYYGWSKITNPHFWNTVIKSNLLYDTFTPGHY